MDPCMVFGNYCYRESECGISTAFLWQNTNNSQLSSFWRRNGSFLRLQEVSLRYSLKHLPWIKSVGLSSVDLEFVANNLFTIDKVKYFDPEQASANGAVYPIPATYAFQVYLRF